MINAAASLDVGSLSLDLSNLEFDGALADHEHLLVLHLVVFVSSVKNCLDVVLYLGLGLFTGVLVLEVERRWDVLWEHSLELHLVKTWLQSTVGDLENRHFVFEELFLVLQLVGVVLNVRLSIAHVSCGVVSNERALLAALNFKFNVVCLDGLHDLNVDNALNRVARLVERLGSLQLDLSLGELAPIV